MEKDKWIKLVGFFTIVGAIAALLVVPEIRKGLGLDSQQSSPLTSSATSTNSSLQSKPADKEPTSVNPNPVPPRVSRWEIDLDPKQLWQNTGIKVKRGETINIWASGSVTWDGTDSSNSVGPNGASYSPARLDDKSGFPLIEAPCGSLIMRIGESFYPIGEKASISCQEDSTIRFMINDRINWLNDNSGSLHIVIEKK
jgi:hypothetical protein